VWIAVTKVRGVTGDDVLYTGEVCGQKMPQKTLKTPKGGIPNLIRRKLEEIRWREGK